MVDTSHTLSARVLRADSVNTSSPSVNISARNSLEQRLVAPMNYLVAGDVVALARSLLHWTRWMKTPAALYL